MKQILFFFVFFILFAGAAYGQSLCAYIPKQPLFDGRSLVLLDSSGTHKAKLCTVTKVGLVSVGAGLVSFLVGVAIMDTHDRYLQTHKSNDQGIGDGIYPAVFGILTFGVGTGLAVGGGIHDIVNHRKHRLSVVAPRGNQLGLAYNF